MGGETFDGASMKVSDILNPLPTPGVIVGARSMAVGALGRPPGAPPGPPGSARWLPGTA